MVAVVAVAEIVEVAVVVTQNWAAKLAISGIGFRGHYRVPPDSTLTPWNETALFNHTLGYLDYAAWGELAGLLSKHFPSLSVLTVDDFLYNMSLTDTQH